MVKQNLLTKLLLLFALIVGSTSVWGQNYSSFTLTFKESSSNSDSSTAYSTTVSDVLDEGEEYVSSLTLSRVYPARTGRGAKFGGSNNAGNIEFTLSDEGCVKATKVVIKGGAYISSNTAENSSVKVNGGTPVPFNQEVTTYTEEEITYTFPTATDITTLKLEQVTSNKGRFYIVSVTIFYEDKDVIKHNLSSAVSPANSGTVTLASTLVGEGYTTSINATPSDGYRFVNWSVSGEGSSVTTATDVETIFTMGTEDATVTANFEEIPSHTATFSVNGTLSTQDFKEGASIVFPEVVDVAGLKCIGWTTSAISGTQNDSPTLVTDPIMDTSDITFFAVFALVTESETTGTKVFEITNKDFTDHISGSYAEGSFTVTHEGEDYTIVYYACKQASMCQLKDQTNPVPCIYVPELPGNINNISTTVCANGSGNAYNGTIHIKSQRTRGNADTNDITKADLSNVTSFSIDLTGENKAFYLTTSAVLRIQDLKVTYEAIVKTVTTTNYCTSIAVPASITSAGYATFSNDNALDFSANADLTIYTATENATSVTLNEVTSKKVPANTPVVLKGAAGSYLGAVISSAEGLGANDLHISDGATATSDQNIYVLANKTNGVGFYKWAGESSLSAGKIYLKATSNAPFLGFDGTGTTGINSVERGELSVEGCYTLDGRRVAQPTKGLYIVNGKKVIIK